MRGEPVRLGPKLRNGLLEVFGRLGQCADVRLNQHDYNTRSAFTALEKGLACRRQTGAQPLVTRHGFFQRLDHLSAR